MFFIEGREERQTYTYYKMTINEEYVAWLNERITSDFEVVNFVPLTLEDVKNIFNGESPRCSEIIIRKIYYIYYTLDDYIHEVINEALWNKDNIDDVYEDEAGDHISWVVE